MSNNESISLSDEDWDILLPSRPITLGKKTIHIKPVGLEEFSYLTSHVIHATKEIQSIPNLKDAASTPGGFKKIVSVIVREAPEIITLLTGLSKKDILKLPIEKSVEIASVAWEVNLQDQESLEKNLVSLAGMIEQLTGGALQQMTTDQAV